MHYLFKSQDIWDLLNSDYIEMENKRPNLSQRSNGIYYVVSLTYLRVNPILPLFVFWLRKVISKLLSMLFQVIQSHESLIQELLTIWLVVLIYLLYIFYVLRIKKYGFWWFIIINCWKRVYTYFKKLDLKFCSLYS